MSKLTKYSLIVSALSLALSALNFYVLAGGSVTIFDSRWFQ